ncbi:YjhG/YagF family D-xylonate dehydratase [Thermogutta sp.]|uniref:YjhG/YagF family D-xylonate dehydratase n=1 Tax=Thermogutta sp. TaxID=1962930 RepID=UPI00321FE461
MTEASHCGKFDANVEDPLHAGDRIPEPLRVHSAGPDGELPFDDALLRYSPSGHLFGMSQDVGMGWAPEDTLRPRFVILSTLGGLRDPDGRPIALGYHTGHFELDDAVRQAAEEIKRCGGIPYAGYCSDPCDGRTQGTPGMFDSLPYRNDAAIVFRRLARSIPNAVGVLGVATCDKGLPAMMMALAGLGHLPSAIVPGGVMLPTTRGEDTAQVQSLGARYAQGEISLERARDVACHSCASPGGGCQFLGTAATSQVVAEALGLTLPHAALVPSGQEIWRDLARRTARALMRMAEQKLTVRDILTEASAHNAMVIHAAFGGSTNLILHLPAVLFSAGLPRPTIEDWERINRQVPRLVDVLPNGPRNFPTLYVYLAGGVPEVMLHLRRLNLLRLDARTITGKTWREILEWWEHSPRRQRVREILRQQAGVDPHDVILSPEKAQAAGITSTTCFPRGNLAPGGSVIKSTAIDPQLLDAHGVYDRTLRARVFVSEADAVAAVKGQLAPPVQPGDVVVLIGRGPLGSGMEETYQLTSALRYLPWGREVAVLTDARFSGVSTGACVGWITPEALADGPIARVRDGDRIRIRIDTQKLEGSVDWVGDGVREYPPEEAARILAQRSPHPQLRPDPRLPEDTQLWAILQAVSGGPWGGCVFDLDILRRRLGG